uniref:Uncharacterized protein n=1 Tax=Anguilla anguilla TaxID=7936 RepID=A0A0E9SMY1_ANGAN
MGICLHQHCKSPLSSSSTLDKQALVCQ